MTKTPPMMTGKSSTMHQRGDVLLVPFPFSDLSTTKVRPAVVVSSALYHATRPDLLLAALTSKVLTATGPLDFVLSDWEAAGLRFPSALKPVLFTLDPARVVLKIGAMSTDDLSQVDERLRRALAL
jgi:mRNA interferase MazF